MTPCLALPYGTTEYLTAVAIGLGNTLFMMATENLELGVDSFGQVGPSFIYPMWTSALKSLVIGRDLSCSFHAYPLCRATQRNIPSPHSLLLFVPIPRSTPKPQRNISSSHSHLPSIREQAEDKSGTGASLPSPSLTPTLCANPNAIQRSLTLLIPNYLFPASQVEDKSGTWCGVMLLLLFLFFDSFTSQWQSRMFSKHEVTHSLDEKKTHHRSVSMVFNDGRLMRRRKEEIDVS